MNAATAPNPTNAPSPAAKRPKDLPMNVTIDKQALRLAVQRVYRACSRGLLPITRNIEIVATPGMLRLRATDLDLHLETKVAATVIDPGSTTVPGDLLSKLLRSLPAGDLAIAMDDDHLTITQGTAKFSLFALPTAEFPTFPAPDKRLGIVTGGMLAEAIASTKHSTAAVGSPTSSSILRGINLSTDGERMRFASTDGYRLTVKRYALPTATAVFDVTLPERLLSTVTAQFPDTEPIAMFANDMFVSFVGAETTATMRKLDGKFPDFERIIPTTFERWLTLNRKALRDAVAQVAIFISDRSHIINLAIKAGAVTIAGDSPDEGKAVVTVPAVLDGEPLELAMNAAYFGDSLRVQGGDRVELQMGGAINPVLILNPEDRTHVCLNMPIRP